MIGEARVRPPLARTVKPSPWPGRCRSQALRRPSASRLVLRLPQVRLIYPLKTAKAIEDALCVEVGVRDSAPRRREVLRELAQVLTQGIFVPGSEAHVAPRIRVCHQRLIELRR